LRGYGVRLTCPHGVGWLTNHMDPMGVNSQYAFRHAPFSQIVSQPRSCLLPSFVRLSYFQFSDRVTKFTPTSSHANVAVILCVICDGHACVIVNSQPTGVPSSWSSLLLCLFSSFSFVRTALVRSGSHGQLFAAAVKPLLFAFVTSMCARSIVCV